jgi:hypothetical protein
MFGYYYAKYKPGFWFVLFLLFASGAVSKSFYAPVWQVLVNAVPALVCLGVSLFYVVRRRNQNQSSSAQDAPNLPSAPVRNARIVLLLTLLGAIAGAAIIPYLKSVLAGNWDRMMEQTLLSFQAIAALTVVQTTVMTLIASALGLSMASKVGLDAPIVRRLLYGGITPRFSAKWLLLAILGSFLGSLLIVGLEVYLFQPNMPVLTSVPQAAWWANMLTALYGGIVEEVLMRLFVMTFIVWLLGWFRVRLRMPIPPIRYWIAIVLASLLFAVGHLPATYQLFGQLTPLLVVRAIIGNGMLGVWFGYLYWKKGFEYAVLSHMAGDVFLHVLLA